MASLKGIVRTNVPLLALVIAGQALAGDISPEKWPATERERAEKQEAAGWTPTAARSISSKNGVVSAISSPIAVQAGVETLETRGQRRRRGGHGGLTEITTQLGSVVSFAGIMSLVYYDAKTGKVHSLDAGYNSYRNETEPEDDPGRRPWPAECGRPGSAGQGCPGPRPTPPRVKDAKHWCQVSWPASRRCIPRFGRLPFADLFEPAIWYAERGVIVNPPLAGCFTIRREFLARTPEGRQFLHQAGNTLPQLGDRFLQPELAKTLRAVSTHGSSYMYTGAWGQDFVKTIQREGGKATIADMKQYRVVWSEPLSTTFAAHRVFTAGPPGNAAYNILPALNLAEEMKLEKRAPFWKDPAALRDLQRISDVIDNAPELDPKVAAFLRGQGIDISPAAQLGKAYAQAVVPLLDRLEAESRQRPAHSNAVVVIDKEGNITAMTHTINSVIWGDTGIVVGGIPIPDSAGFQQARLATIKPGERLPDEMVQTIVLTGDKPILATAAIGSSGILETVKVVLGVAGQGLDLATVQAAPPPLYNFMLAQPGQSVLSRGLAIPDGAYPADFVKNLQAMSVKVTKIPAATANGLRGTVVAVKIDPVTGEKQTVETPGVLIFGGAE